MQRLITTRGEVADFEEINSLVIRDDLFLMNVWVETEDYTGSKQIFGRLDEIKEIQYLMKKGE